ncbi:uncharacterized protein TRAVEDRAFT_44872 [Trametes versicolor FP-101664 SS1]|uniref:uncharacterized protein n=1 Tax=Trametes versicolor (strain FP-101664) TaxID=717944 RepID=UPI0004623FB9|nr:uncharacterized protein TRAVEDRAFT_44872 [Trametes versicolor FP-101664 SS1]EIW62036.1 hypothetical protein TRAVEDRAFT_44872 [Trametes versicolor FP-101664 SS1]
MDAIIRPSEDAPRCFSGVKSKCPNGPVLSTLTSKAPVQDIAPRYISEHCVTYAPWLGAVFVCDELYKLIDGKKNIEAYKNGFVKFALLFIGPSESIPRKMDKNHFELENDLTLKDIVGLGPARAQA